MDFFETWRSQRVLIESRLSADEAAARLAGSLSNSVGSLRLILSQADPGPSRQTIGEVRGRQVRIRVHRPLRRDSWLPELRGEFRASAAGSELVGTLRYRPFVRALSAFWLLAVLTATSSAAVVGLVLFAQGRTHDGRQALFVTAFTAGMLAFGTTLTTTGGTGGKANQEYLRRWVQEALDSEPAN